MKTCLVCAGVIERGGRKGGPLPTYCSPQCKQRARSQREEQDGRAEARNQRERERKAQTRVKQQTRPCLYCDSPMAATRRTQCGKPECVKQAKANRMREYMRKYRETDGGGCRLREMEYAKAYREKNGHWRQRYPAAAAAIDARRRMRVLVATVESFAPREVYERDGWVCQLCRLPIDPGVAWPDPMSPSVDHRVPLAKGGEHSMANVQAAHLGCNSRKHDQSDGPGSAAGRAEAA